MPTSGGFFEPTGTVRSSVLVPESVQDIIGGFLSSLLSVLDASTLGSLIVKAVSSCVLSPTVGVPGLGFLATNGAFFSRNGVFVPGPTFLPPGTTLVALKRKKFGAFGFLENTGLSASLSLAPSFLLTRGLVLAITVAEGSLL